MYGSNRVLRSPFESLIDTLIKLWPTHTAVVLLLRSPAKAKARPPIFSHRKQRFDEGNVVLVLESESIATFSI